MTPPTTPDAGDRDQTRGARCDATHRPSGARCYKHGPHDVHASAVVDPSGSGLVTWRDGDREASPAARPAPDASAVPVIGCGSRNTRPGQPDCRCGHPETSHSIGAPGVCVVDGCGCFVYTPALTSAR